jgi:hypothetical protein
MALLDEGETDWKIIAIDINDPLAAKLNDIEDVERHLPGLLRATNEFWRIYKIPDGKPENSFAFSGECKNKKYALEVIKECNEAWERLITGKVKAPEGVNTYLSPNTPLSFLGFMGLMMQIESHGRQFSLPCRPKQGPSSPSWRQSTPRTHRSFHRQMVLYLCNSPNPSRHPFSHNRLLPEIGF